jgi:hypothetical protein
MSYTAMLDAATWQMPAILVAMAHKEDPPFLIGRNPTRAERHAAAHPPPGPNERGQRPRGQEGTTRHGLGHSARRRTALGSRHCWFSRPSWDIAMIALGVILGFVAIVFLLNVVDFGRVD